MEEQGSLLMQKAGLEDEISCQLLSDSTQVSLLQGQQCEDPSEIELSSCEAFLY